MLDISLSADKIIKISDNIYLTNTVLATWVTMAVLLVFSLIALWQLKRGKNTAIVAFSRLVVKSFFNFINSILEDEKISWAVLPLIAMLFLYIVSANWIALIPGFIGSFVIRVEDKAIPIFKSVNADLNSTASMAITSIIIIKILTIKFSEAKSYLRIGVNKAFQLVISAFERLSELTRVVSLSFRLTGNIFAGEVLMLVLAFVSPYLVPVPFMFLEFFIGAFQALVFSVLILVFVKW